MTADPITITFTDSTGEVFEIVEWRGPGQGWFDSANDKLADTDAELAGTRHQILALVLSDLREHEGDI